MFNNRILRHLLCILFLACVTTNSLAAGYTDVSVEYLNVKIEGNKLNPLNAKLKLGYALSRELAIEASYAGPIRDDEINGLKLELDETMGAYLRYNGPDSYGGITIYLLAGYAWTTVKTSGANAIPNQDFESFSWGAGIEERSRGASRMRYTFQYTQYFDDDGLSIDGFSLGLRYDF